MQIYAKGIVSFTTRGNLHSNVKFSSMFSGREKTYTLSILVNTLPTLETLVEKCYLIITEYEKQFFEFVVRENEILKMMFMTRLEHQLAQGLFTYKSHPHSPQTMLMP